ncbi:glycosyltransferase family 9 protein [Spirosoma sp. KNUC1025]|uniref:glycosyltransferase family 9 protein n=1 Tax=Spirosoma sp. KNUC1025 TaxID=2894082 RepID=UPI0038708420|nr:lipopolysaccharide heptosyltransferase family protein [Spirosoma sp. KNUC1025]
MIAKARKYCAPRSIGYPLQVLDVAVDAYANRIYKRRSRPQTDPAQPRFLLMTSGHLGDALTLSYLFPLIRRQYPTCVIDVVAGSWCDPILAKNPYIRRLIHLNHANTNRSKKSRLAKWREHVQTMRTAIGQLKTETYTAAVDIRFSDSPMLFLLPFINVSRAVGFGTRGFGGLLDEEFFLPDEEFHHLDVILTVLRAIGVDATLRDVKPYFQIPDAARQALQRKLPIASDEDSPLILLCPESGEPSRFLPESFWRALATNLLTQTNCRLVGCGQLPQTTQLMAAIGQDNPTATERLYDTVGQLNINELAALSERAAVAITLESLPAHLCSIFCPTVSYFYRGVGFQFFPMANHPVMIFHNHPYSRNLTLDRPDFTSEYVTEFGVAVQKQSLQWIQSVLVKKEQI